MHWALHQQVMHGSHIVLCVLIEQKDREVSQTVCSLLGSMPCCWDRQALWKALWAWTPSHLAPSAATLQSHWASTAGVGLLASCALHLSSSAWYSVPQALQEGGGQRWPDTTC